MGGSLPPPEPEQLLRPVALHVPPDLDAVREHAPVRPLRKSGATGALNTQPAGCLRRFARQLTVLSGGKRASATPCAAPSSGVRALSVLCRSMSVVILPGQ